MTTHAGELRHKRGRSVLQLCYWTLAMALLSLLAPLRPVAAQRFATGDTYAHPAGKSPTAQLVRDIRIDQHLNAPLPLNAVFNDETGRAVRLEKYFGDKPVVLVLVQYRCPMLCNQVLNGFLKSSQGIPLEMGRDYQVVTVSFDAREGAELAREKKQHYLRAYRRPGGAAGWHFLTGQQAAIDQLTEAIGFRYQYDASSDQFAHPSGIVVATPDGRLSHYFYGIDYPPPDLRLGLVDSSAGQIGSPVDQVLLLCYHYDPLTGKYGLAIAGGLRIAGVLTMVVIGAFLLVMVQRERRRPKLFRNGPAAAPSESIGQYVPFETDEPTDDR